MIGSALEGVRVVDLTTSVAGPFASQILGDLGADVIKVEKPGHGDDTRSWGPPFWQGESPSFLAHNRNKRSVVIDLKDESGLETFRKLLSTADVFVQNLRPGALEALELGYDDAAAMNPRLIYCDMSGYGATGPKADMPAYDPLMQAYGGLMSLTGEAGRPPVRTPASILDQGTGMWTAIGVLAALRTREESGLGTHLQTSLLGSALMWLPNQFIGYFADGTLPQRLGSGTVGIYPYGAFATEDSHLIVAAGNQALWTRLCLAIGRPELLEDPRFSQNPDRVSNRVELEAELTRTFRGRSRDHWLDVLAEVGVPASPVHSLDEVAADAHVVAMGGFAAVDHPRIPDFRLVNLPIQESGEYVPVRRVPPMLGEHTDEVLKEVNGG